MYQPRTEYRHRPYKTDSRSGADIFFACARAYIILFTLFAVTRFIADRPAFQFHKIIIRGTHAVSVADVEKVVRLPMEQKLLWTFKKNNELLYPTRSVRSAVAAVDSRIASVAISTTRNTVEVDLQEYEPTFRYCIPHLSRSNGGTLGLPSLALNATGTTDIASTTMSNTDIPGFATTTLDNSSSSLQYVDEQVLSSGLLELPTPEPIGVDSHDCYWADDRGYIFAKAPQYSGSPLLTITESDPSRNATLAGEPPIKEKIFTDEEMAHLSSIIQMLNESNFAIRQVVRMQTGDAILDVGYPWNLAVNLDTEPKSEINHFFLSLKELGDIAVNENSQLKIIDVRFGNKVFYR